MIDRNKIKSPGISIWFSIIWIVFILSSALCAGFLSLPEYDHIDWENPSAPPGTSGEMSAVNSIGQPIQKEIVYFFGTDTMGRDILTRLIFGARISLIIGLAVPFIGIVIGGWLGMLAGFYTRKVETVIMATMDTILAFPGIVLLLAITFYLGHGIENIVTALGILVIPAFTRVARANTLKYSQSEFVQAARMLGHNDAYILICEILPNIIMPMVVYALMLVSYMIVAEGVLSFLGLSVTAPIPSWGGMISEGKEALEESPHITFFPAFFMFLTVLSFNLLGDYLRTLVDTKEGQL